MAKIILRRRAHATPTVDATAEPEPEMEPAPEPQDEQLALLRQISDDCHGIHRILTGWIVFCFVVACVLIIIALFRG